MKKQFDEKHGVKPRSYQTEEWLFFSISSLFLIRISVNQPPLPAACLSTSITHFVHKMVEMRVFISVSFGLLALILNLLLAKIILTTKCFYIGKYKFFLFLYTISAAIYAFAQIATAGSFIMFSNGCIFYDTLRILPVFLGTMAIEIYVTTFLQNFIILTLSFAYRYLVVCRPQHLELFLKYWKRITLLSILIIFYGVAIMTYTLYPSKMAEEVLSADFFAATGFRLNETAYNAGVISYRGQFNWNIIIALGSFGAIVFTSAGIIITLALKTANQLDEMAKRSQNTAKHQRKVFVLLIFQITLPVIFNIIPMQFVAMSTYLQLPTHGLVENVGCILTIAQICDPIVIFYFIKPYRQAVWGRKQRSSSVSFHSHSVPKQSTLQSNF